MPCVPPIKNNLCQQSTIAKFRSVVLKPISVGRAADQRLQSARLQPNSGGRAANSSSQYGSADEWQQSPEFGGSQSEEVRRWVAAEPVERSWVEQPITGNMQLIRRAANWSSLLSFRGSQSEEVRSNLSSAAQQPIRRDNSSKAETADLTWHWNC